MPKYVIERDIKGIGDSSNDDFKKAAQTSCKVLREMGTDIQWLHSYVAKNKLFCIYISPNEERILEHAKKSGFPADKIFEISRIVEPITSE